MNNLINLVEKYGNLTMEMQSAANRAHLAFLGGYNCAQAMLIGFEDKLNMPIGEATRLAQPFGGGFSRLREVCGAVSGATIIIGIIFGNNQPKDYARKKFVYELTQKFAKRFEEVNGSYICRELLGLQEKSSHPAPEQRSTKYYQKRPCADLVWVSAALVAQLIAENN